MNVPASVLASLCAIVVVLLVASFIVRRMQSRAPDKDYSELSNRVRTWWIMVGVFFSAMIISRNLSICFFAFISFLALKEYLTMIPTRRADRRVLLWLYGAVPIQYLFVYLEWYGMFIIFIPVYLFLFLPMRMVMIGETTGFIKAVGTLHWGAMTTVFSLSHIAFLLVLPPVADAAGGPALVLFLVILTQLNDVAQYIWGKKFGRRKIVPSVSPNKTWEGFLGGVGTTTLLAMLIAPLLTPLTFGLSVLAGLLISIGGFVGDVTISAVKRDLGAKDTGALLPGHGGILDRVDSLTYTAPLFFHFIWYFYY